MTLPPEFLDQFFGTGNRLKLDVVEARPRLRELRDDVHPALARPAVLPRMRDGSDEIDWYVLTGTAEDHRRAAEEVRGFIGPTYGRWAATPSGPTDPVEALLDDVLPHRWLRFGTAGDDEFRAVWEPLSRLRALWRNRPTRGTEARRPVSVVVRDIDMALAAGATASARRDLAELRARGAISAQNARFVEVRALAREQRWAEIVASPWFPDLCRIRRPWDITEALAAAVQRTLFREATAASDVDEALAAYQRRQRELDPLLRVRGPMRRVEALLAHAVHLVAQAGARSAVLALEGALEAPEDRLWLHRLADRAMPDEPGPAKTPRYLLDAGDFEPALAAACVGRSVDDVRVALLAAYEIGALEAAAAAIALWNEVQEDVRDQAVDRRVIRDAYATVAALAGGDGGAVTTWGEWFARVERDPQWVAAAAVARCGELEFEARDVLDVDAAGRLSAAIARLAESEARPVVLDALPKLLRWVHAQDSGTTAATTLYHGVLESLALSEGWESATLDVVADVLERLLDTGLGAAAYSDVLETVGLVWGRMVSRIHAPWFVDVLEVLERHPGDRARLTAMAAEGLQRLRALGDLSPMVFDGARASAAALGLQDVLPAPQQDDGAAVLDVAALTGTTVGLYSLTPQVLTRAKQRLESLLPGIAVVTNDDHVATPALTQMARTVDVLVVAIGSAKHAATDAINAARPSNRTTLRDAFKGSTRMVQAVLDELEGRVPV